MCQVASSPYQNPELPQVYHYSGRSRPKSGDVQLSKLQNTDGRIDDELAMPQSAL